MELGSRTTESDLGIGAEIILHAEGEKETTVEKTPENPGSAEVAVLTGLTYAIGKMGGVQLSPEEVAEVSKAAHRKVKKDGTLSVLQRTGQLISDLLRIDRPTQEQPTQDKVAS